MIPATQHMKLILKLSSLQNSLQKKIEQQLSFHGISFTEFLVMYHLNNVANKSMRRIDLAELVGLSASGVTRLLKPMQKMGFVENDTNPRDARVSLIRLTRSGMKNFEDAKISFEHTAALLTQPLDGVQLDSFLKNADLLLPESII